MASPALAQPQHLGVLQVEPTDHCNLACRMCAPHFEGWAEVHGVPKGFLDPTLWDRVLASLVEDDLRFDHLIFQWLGDPSLHPALHRLVGAAAAALAGRVHYLRVDTNGILLDERRIDALLDALPPAGTAPPLLLVWTLDAHSPEVYQQVKGRDHLLRVRRHLRHLLRARRQADRAVNVQVQFVVQQGNDHEVGPFVDYWSDLFGCQGDEARFHDELLLKRLSVAGGGPGQAAADARYERALAAAGVGPGRRGALTIHTWAGRPWQIDDGHAAEARGACPGLWLTPVIRHDGQLIMCCADLHSETALGSLSETRFSTLWQGAPATARRLAHLAGRFEGPCAGCGGINWYSLPPGHDAETRARAAALGLPAPTLSK